METKSGVNAPLKGIYFVTLITLTFFSYICDALKSNSASSERDGKTIFEVAGNYLFTKLQ